jgi:hypothetical protein
MYNKIEKCSNINVQKLVNFKIKIYVNVCKSDNSKINVDLQIFQ